MNIEQTLYDTAVDFIKNRYPTGWGGAAAIHTVDDRILISVAPEALNAGVELCIETGAICEAHKWNTQVHIAFALFGMMNTANSRCFHPVVSARSACATGVKMCVSV